MENKYGFGKTVAGEFTAIRERVIAELGKEGFGVLTEIDVAATLKKKIDHDMLPYVILGACNPPFAKRAIEAEPTVGLLMPCNVVVRQDESGVQVEFMDPGLMSQMTESPALVALATEVRGKIRKVMDAV